MSNYPSNIDNNITLPGVSGSSQEDTAITALRSAVFAIEVELGLTPSGIYPDVRTRLDILESRINFSTSAIEPGILNDGYVKSPLYIWNIPQNLVLSISDGYGPPTENRIPGSLYMRGFGTANNELYIRRSDGYWYPIQTDLFVAAHDLAGTYNFQTVVGIQGKKLNTTVGTVGATQDGYFLMWSNSDGYWEPQTGFIAAGDLAPNSPFFGRTNQTVVGIRKSPVSSTPPTDGYTFVWSTADNQWEPQARAVVFDGYVSRVNIRSNRFKQSPILNTQTGIVNLGTDTGGLTTGATGNYSMILGGDRNVSSGTHSAVVSGFSNLAQDGYSLVVAGNTNSATAQSSTVINGTSNIANAVQSTVTNGSSNLASGTNSFVLNGTGNIAAANFSGILNGTSNSISVGALHTGIGFGTNNQITGGAASNNSIIVGGSSNTVSSANNAFVGAAASTLVQGDYAVVLSGVSNSIATLSDYTIILSGISNSATVSSEFSFIGSGNSNTVTGHYASILTADTSSVNALHGMIVNGANNLVTGQYSTILNGNNNTANGTGWSLILDGYNNTVSGTGSFIADGYNNTVSGLFSSIINGNFNTISGRNCTILNGANNNIDAGSIESSVIVGENNTFTNSANTTATGSGNIFTNATSTFVVGTSNNIQSTASFVNGSTNILSPGTTNNRMFGSFNTLGTGASVNFIIGNGNNVGPTATTTNINIFGANNVVDGAVAGSINGTNNIVNANLTNTHGQYGKARMFGQEVRANGRFTGTTIAPASGGQILPQATINVVSTTNFPASGTVAVVSSTGLQTISYAATTPTSLTGCTGGTGVIASGAAIGKIGETQWSRLILDGYSLGGTAIPLQLQDIVAVNPTFVDGYSYDMSIKVLIVNTSPITPNPVVPARYYIDVLAHQEAGLLVLDNVNYTLSTPNTVDSPTRTPWTVSVVASGNQLLLTVDPEVPTAYVQPGNTPSARRAMASIDMREISRI